MGGGPDGVPVMNFSLNTPKEIEAWISERKKKWPTDSTVQKKQQDLNERIARGEIVPNDRKRRNEKGGRGGAKRGRGTDQRGSFEGRDRMVPPSNQPAVYPESNPSSAATAATNLYLTFTPPKPPPPPKEQTAGLVAGYGSTSEEDEDDGPPEVVSSKQPDNSLEEDGAELPMKNKLACKYFARGKCGKGTKCRFTHDQSNKQTKRTEPTETEIFRRRPGLLSQLLAKEIRTETSTILQCLRFMVKNRFFDKGVQVWDVGISGSNPVLAQEELVDESEESEADEVDVDDKVQVQQSTLVNYGLPKEMEGDVLDWGSSDDN